MHSQISFPAALLLIYSLSTKPQEWALQNCGTNHGLTRHYSIHSIIPQEPDAMDDIKFDIGPITRDTIGPTTRDTFVSRDTPKSALASVTCVGKICLRVSLSSLGLPILTDSDMFSILRGIFICLLALTNVISSPSHFWFPFSRREKFELVQLRLEPGTIQCWAQKIQ